MRVLILAAGYGTRLYPYIKNCPKPLLNIGKKPLINHLLEKIKRLKDVSSVSIVTNDRFFQHFQEWQKGLRFDYPIRILNDFTTGPEDRLGAIGDMHFAFQKEKFADDFLVLGGDNLFRGTLDNFLSFAKKNHPCISIGVCDIKNKKKASRFGVVDLDKDKRILQLYEKPQNPQSSLVAMCLYYFPKSKLKLIKEYLSVPEYSRDTAGSYINWLSNKDKVYGYTFRDLWFDIGHIHTYRKVKNGLGRRR